MHQKQKNSKNHGEEMPPKLPMDTFEIIMDLRFVYFTVERYTLAVFRVP